MADGAEDRRCRRNQRRFADALRAVGSFRVLVFDDVDRHWRHVAYGRDQVVVQIFRAAGDEFLHQRQPESLRDAAVDLTFHQRRIDRASDVVRGVDVQHLRRAER